MGLMRLGLALTALLFAQLALAASAPPGPAMQAATIATLLLQLGAMLCLWAGDDDGAQPR